MFSKHEHGRGAWKSEQVAEVRNEKSSESKKENMCVKRRTFENESDR